MTAPRVDGSATSIVWDGELGLNGTKTSVEWELDSYIERPNFPHLVDRQRERSSHYLNQIRAQHSTTEAHITNLCREK